MTKKTGPVRAPTEYIPYPAAMRLLSEHLPDAPTQEDLAAWVFLGPERDGLAAYINANEMDEPPRFYFGPEDDDYIASLMACWFRQEEIRSYKVAVRYITWSALIERWGKLLDGRPDAFVRAKIAESRLLDMHPVTGVTRGTFPGNESLPPIESALFQLSQVEAIEAEDFECGQHVEETKPASQNQGLPAKRIWEHFHFWDEGRWRELLSNPPQWLVDGRVGPVAHRRAALWDPATIATCLLAYREKYWHSDSENRQRLARKIPPRKQLECIIHEHFSDWADELQFDLD